LVIQESLHETMKVRRLKIHGLARHVSGRNSDSAAKRDC
jgi:hypothetical protein